MTYMSAGKTLVIHSEKCIGCTRCVEVCPHEVIAMQGKKASVDKRKNCMECGACRQNCPAGAIDVTVGVGCAYAVISGLIHKTEPTCGCSGKKGTCC
jgi:NAD-dependent dihydropyrimidine dehydrogenase PreA subunit